VNAFFNFVKSEKATMEILGRCPEAAVFHSTCLLAEQVSAVNIAVLCN